jgi:hypothetical protein
MSVILIIKASHVDLLNRTDITGAIDCRMVIIYLFIYLFLTKSDLDINVYFRK